VVETREREKVRHPKSALGPADIMPQHVAKGDGVRENVSIETEYRKIIVTVCLYKQEDKVKVRYNSTCLFFFSHKKQVRTFLNKKRTFCSLLMMHATQIDILP
jgi:hypothetical protein